MQRFKNILLVCDGADDDAVIQQATALAHRNGARLTVMDVLPAAPIGQDRAGVPTALLQAELLAERQATLANLVDGQTAVRVEIGTPFLTVIRQVLASGHDLLIKAPEHSIGQSLALGSTDMHLLRKCPCPVWMIRPDTSPARAVLAAVDVDSPDTTAQRLNGLILDLARSLATITDAPLHVVHAWTLFGENLLRGGRAGVDMDRVLTQTQDHYQRQLGTLLAAHPSEAPPWRRHLLRGEPEIVIPALVARAEIGMLVMGTVARTGIAGFLIGNTAERLLTQVHCSVMALKPEGFQTPVHDHD